MIWQDGVLTFFQLGFLWALIPMVRDPRTRVNLFSSWVNTIGLLATAFILVTLDLILSPIIVTVSAILWAVIALRRQQP
jgi:hypothetical protein